MAELGLFGELYPPWYTPSKERPKGNMRVFRGHHPLGLPLGPAHSKCGTCKHLHRRRLAKVYLKCALSTMSRGPASDIRVKWRGCQRWEDGI